MKSDFMELTAKIIAEIRTTEIRNKTYIDKIDVEFIKDILQDELKECYDEGYALGYSEGRSEGCS